MNINPQHVHGLELKIKELRDQLDRVCNALRTIEHACVIREATGIIEIRLILDEIKAARHNTEIHGEMNKKTAEEIIANLRHAREKGWCK